MATVFVAPRASAQYSQTQEFQTGFSLLRFEPAKAGDRFFGVPDGFVPGNPSSRFRAQLLADFATAPLLSRTNNLNGQTVDVISKQFVTHLGVGYFPLDQLLLTADLPLALSQSGDSPTTPDAGAGDLVLGMRYGLLGSENSAFSLAPALDVWLPTGSQDQLTGDGKLRAQPELSFGGRADIFIWSGALGYQLRRQLDIGAVEIGNSYVFGAAAGLLLFDDALQVGPELHGAALSAPSTGSAFASRNTMLEALFGAKVHAGDFVFGAAAGPGLARAPGTAPRLLLSVAFAPRAPYVREAPPSTAQPKPEAEAVAKLEPEAAKPEAAKPEPEPKPEPEAAKPPPAPAAPPPPGEEDTDADGIPDNQDACKRVKGVASETPSQNGCPAPPPPAPPPPPKDSDRDGIPDHNDACPKKKGVASDDPKLNGCPALVEKAIATPRIPPAPPAPPPDSDGDGISDRLDACPHEAGVHSPIRKRNGCPVPSPATAAGAPAELTFSGFHSFDDGSSLVFVELTRPVTVEERKLKGAVVYTLENTKVPVRNNRNPLMTVDFSSIVRRALIAQRKKSVEITIFLKADAELEHRIVQRGGAAVLEIRLPKTPPTPPPTGPATKRGKSGKGQ